MRSHSDTPLSASQCRHIPRHSTGRASRRPEAYGSTFESSKGFTFDMVLKPAWRFCSWRFPSSELVGIAGLLIREGEKEAHKGLLRGMYVRPSCRKTGVGRRLIETIIEFARQRVELIQLSVVRDNDKRAAICQSRFLDMESRRRP